MNRAVREAFVLASVAVGLAAVVYLNALRNPFIYDDLVTIVLNRALAEAWTLTGALALGAFRPLTALSYAIDYAIWGLDPFGYHLTNVLLHLVNVALVFRVGWVLAVDDERGDGPAPGNPGVFAFALAALFAVHPALTQAVGYVSARSEVLCATLFLGAFLAFRRGFRSGRARCLVAGVVLFVATLGAREIGAALPFVLVVSDAIVLAVTGETFRRRLLRWHLPLLAVTTIAGVLRLVVFVGHEGGAVDGAVRHVVTQAGVLWRYVALLCLPTGLSLVHHVPSAEAGDARALLGVAGLVALVAVAVLARRRAPLAALGVAWFLLVLAPSSLVPLKEPMAEHRVYLASVGFFLAVVAIGAQVADRLVAPWPRRRAAAAALVALLVTGLGALTITRNRVWANPVTLWRDAARKAPAAWMARSGFGNALGEAGDCAAAIPELEAALRLEPDPGTATNLGTCLIAERRPEEAVAAYRRALEIDPRYVPAHHNLALMALTRGDRERAHHHFLMSIVPDWRRPKWRDELIALHERWFREPAKTLELCREMLRVASETPGVRECLERNEARRGAPVKR